MNAVDPSAGARDAEQPVQGLLATLDLLRITRAGPVLHLQLNRPAKRNALSDPFIQQLHTVFVNMPEGVRAVMISGQRACAIACAICCTASAAGSPRTCPCTTGRRRP